MPKGRSKTEQTLQAIQEKCAQIKYGEWQIKLIIHNGEIVGFEQEHAPLIRFRASAAEGVEK